MLFGALRADGPVTIDLTKVSYLDATMLTALLKLQARFKEHSIKLLVRSTSFAACFESYGSNQLFEIVDA